MPQALLVPGFGGSARQPMLVRLSRLLVEQGLDAEVVELPRRAPSAGLAVEQAVLRERASGPLAGRFLVGRSFGGRVCARLAVAEPCRALVVLGYPVRPPGKKRPDDEAALAALRCPTLILQGDRDELGPLRVLRPLVRKNSFLTLEVVKGAEHSFGRFEGAVLIRAAQWLAGFV